MQIIEHVVDKSLSLVVRPSKPSSSQFVKVEIVGAVELAQIANDHRINLRVLSALVLIQTPFTRLLVTSNTVETLGGVVDKVLTTDLMLQSKESFDLL